MNIVKLKNEDGGNILQHIKRRKELKKADRVEIEGYLASAATIFATLPNAVLKPNTVLAFHGAGIGPIPFPFFGGLTMGLFYRGKGFWNYMFKWQFIPPSTSKKIVAKEYKEKYDSKINLEEF